MRAHSKTLAVILPVALFLSLSLPVSQARADLAVSAVGSMNLSNLSVSPSLPTTNLSTGTTFGFGFLGRTSFIPMFSLELGALFIPRKVSVNDLSGNLIQSTSSTFLEVPLLLRFTALPIVSFGAGPYYAHTLGNLTTSTPNQPDTSTPNTTTSDFGFEGSVAASIPILPTISVMGDLRYLFGLTNFDSTGATSMHARDLELLVGLTLSI